MKNAVKICIVDSGTIRVNNKFKLINFRLKDGLIVRCENPDNHKDHCDIITNIINNELEKYLLLEFCHITILNILNENLETCFELLHAAFDYILEENFDIVNFSMGYMKLNNKKYFEECIKIFEEKKCYFICALTKNISYPNIFDNVITVTDRLQYVNYTKGVFCHNRKNDFFVDIENTSYNLDNSYPSYAAPFITAMAAYILYSHDDIKGIKGLRDAIFKFIENHKPPYIYAGCKI